MEDLAGNNANAVYYVFPLFSTWSKADQHAPDLASDTWLVPVSSVPLATLTALSSPPTGLHRVDVERAHSLVTVTFHSPEVIGDAINARQLFSQGVMRQPTEAEIVRLGSPVSSTSAAAIYPSDAKYDESRRVPFMVLQDRFRRALAQPETLTLVAGYSFGDEHLNEVFFDAAARRPRSEIIVFCYSDIPQVLQDRAQLTPNLQAVTTDKAILGGRPAPWQPSEEELGPVDFWIDGKFTLGDFSKLAGHLALSSPQAQVEFNGLSDEILDG